MWSYSYFEKLLGITKNLIGNHGRSLVVDFGCDKVASFNIINEATSSFVLWRFLLFRKTYFKECILIPTLITAFVFTDLFFVWLTSLKWNSSFTIKRLFSEILFKWFKTAGITFKMLCVLVNQYTFLHEEFRGRWNLICGSF